MAKKTRRKIDAAFGASSSGSGGAYFGLEPGGGAQSGHHLPAVIGSRTHQLIAPVTADVSSAGPHLIPDGSSGTATLSEMPQIGARPSMPARYDSWRRLASRPGGALRAGNVSRSEWILLFCPLMLDRTVGGLAVMLVDSTVQIRQARRPSRWPSENAVALALSGRSASRTHSCQTP
jgi:hypothetical protein